MSLLPVGNHERDVELTVGHFGFNSTGIFLEKGRYARVDRGRRTYENCENFGFKRGRRTDEMKIPGKIIPRGPFKGKRIEFAPTEELDMFRTLADEFMEEIFCMESGSYLITDESSLRDFQGVEDLELPDIHGKIQEVYGVDVSDIVSGNLVEIFVRIHKHTYGGTK